MRPRRNGKRVDARARPQPHAWGAPLRCPTSIVSRKEVRSKGRADRPRPGLPRPPPGAPAPRREPRLPPPLPVLRYPTDDLSERRLRVPAASLHREESRKPFLSSFCPRSRPVFFFFFLKIVCQHRLLSGTQWNERCLLN